MLGLEQPLCINGKVLSESGASDRAADIAASNSLSASSSATVPQPLGLFISALRKAPRTRRVMQ